MYLYPSAFRYYGGTKEKFAVCVSKSGGKSFTATKGGGRPAHGKQASHFAIRYVAAQCCHYQHSVAAVLENVVFCSERLFRSSDQKYHVKLPRIPYTDSNTLGCGVVENGQLRHYHNGRVDVTNMT